MKRLFVLAISFCLIVGALNAQVETHYYGKDEKPNLRKTISKSTSVKYMPAFDIEKVKKENAELDARTGIFHFGKGFDVSYTLEDGIWEEIDGGRLWTITFESPGALSLNFVFNDFFLPEGAELYVTNKDESVVFGPVTSEALHENGHFLTDIINGSQATISLFEPFECIGQSTLTIKRVVHGCRNQASHNTNSGTRTISDSPDVACYSDYDEVSDGVGLLLTSDGEAYGTCSLVMTTDYSFKPYILTTYFFIDTNYDNIISSQEITDVENCMVKFRCRYETCNGITEVSSYTYNQSYFRSAYHDGGMGLIELRNTLSNNSDLTWLGWYRYIFQPSGSILFHSDDLKLRIMIGALTIPTPAPTYIDYLDIYCDPISYYIGRLSGPAYGAPLLDENQRISAITCNYTVCSDPNLSFNEKAYVRGLIESWHGGLTNSTGLVHWLDPEGKNWYAMPCSRAMKIIGSNQIISSRSYYIQNLPSNMTVTWSLSDTYYNQNCLQQNYPESNQCTISRSPLQEMTNATLTATLSRNDTIICTFPKTVSTSDGFDGTYYNGVTTQQIDLPSPLVVLPGITVRITSPNLVGASITQTGGNLTPNYISFNNAHNEMYIGMPSSPFGTIVLSVSCSNGAVYTLPIMNTLSSQNSLLSVTPSGNQLEVSLSSCSENRNDMSYSVANRVGSASPSEWNLEVYHAQTGERTANEKVYGSTVTLDTSSWKSGVYIVRASIGKEVLSEKVFVK